MLKCCVCKVNYAVVFVTKISQGKQTQEGLCLSCAKKQGLRPLDGIMSQMSQMGLTDEDVDALTRQMGEVLGNIEQIQGDALTGFNVSGDLSGILGGVLGVSNDGPDGDGPDADSDAYDVGTADGDGTDGDGVDQGKTIAAGQGGPFWQGGPFMALTMFPSRGGVGDDEHGLTGGGPGGISGGQGGGLIGGGGGSGGRSDSRTKTVDKRPRRKKFLDLYGTNLTDLAREGRIDRVIGRQKEIDRTIQILNRRLKNNPLLTGEPGVGKTAIAEGLAVRVVSKNVPAKLYNYEIYRIDMTNVVAGTQFRGQFESRMKGIIDEARNFGNIILVIDEIHNLLGAGEADGAMNAANILKPALARGEIQVIGATTLREYRRHIERDQALERRFQSVLVDEPSVEDTIEILKGIKDYYEDYHKVRISDEVIDAAARMSERYITDRFLPDKAIDVIDEASSFSNLQNSGLVELERLREELRGIQEEKNIAISVDSIEDYQKAAELKTREYKLVERIKEAERLYVGLSVTLDDVAQVIESWTKIPLHKLTKSDAERLLDLEERVHTRLIGQNGAVESVCKSIRRSRSGFRKIKKPASFIFVGPTGVGKTELVKTLAREVFGSEDSMVRLDMSEYMEKHTVSKLIGSPPGYVGYDDAGQFTEKIRRRPYSIVLLDEIEKAHPDVFNVLLQILDDGRLTDSQGRVVNFENTIIIMTSNAGTSFKSASIGFGGADYRSMEKKAESMLKDIFRPEFLNRIDSVAVFKELERDEMQQIVCLMLNEVVAEAAENEIRVTYDRASLPGAILDAGAYKRGMGARPFRHEIQKRVEDVLSDMYLRGELVSGDAVNIMARDGQIVMDKE